MKKGWAILKQSGVSIFVFLLLCSLAKEYLLTPVLSKLWSLSLATTPDGFISNANLVNTLIKSPWIMIAGALILFVYLFFIMWETTATITAIGYGYQGQRIRFRDLVLISLKKQKCYFKPSNWMIFIYAIVIIPFADIFQACQQLKAFMMPEYIQDFINAKPVLFVLYFILGLMISYIALRWLFLLPSMILKDYSFKQAANESKSLTKKNFLAEGIKLGIYQVIEVFRLGFIPFALLIVVSAAFIVFYYDVKGSTELICYLSINFGAEFIVEVIESLTYISCLCYLLSEYFNKLQKNNLDDQLSLPELKQQSKKKFSIISLQLAISVFSCLILSMLIIGSIQMIGTTDDILSQFINKTVIVAHKGYSSKAPENTMAAFELADKNENTDYIELDVWMSKDNVPVVIHNASIKDATGNDGMVYDYTVAQLQQMVASYSYDQEEYPDTTIPTLEEVLAKYASTTPIVIEIKGYSQNNALAQAIVDLMEKYNATETSMIQSGDYQSLKAIKEINPKIKCGLIMAVMTGNYYDLPYADFFTVEHTFVTSNMVQQIHLRGKKIFVWTVNYSESASKLKSFNVDGIITDYPDEMKEYFNGISHLLEIFNSNTQQSDLEDY